MDAPVLHDELDVTRDLKQPDVVMRLTGDHHQVGQETFRYFARPAFQHHGRRACPGRGNQRLRIGVAEKFHEMADIARVGAMRRPWKAVVSAHQHAHAALAQLGEYALRAFELVDHAGCFGLLKGNAPLPGLVHEVVQQPDCGCYEYALARRLQEVQAFLVGIFAVIEDVDSVPERELDRGRSAHMGSDALAVRVRGQRSRADFHLVHDILVGTRVRNGLVSGDVQLDRVDAFADQHPACFGHLVAAVYDHGDRFAMDVHEALVAEVAGIGEFGTGREHAGSGNIARIDGVAHYHIDARFRRAAADTGGKAGFQHEARMLRRAQRVFFGRHVAGVGDAGLVQEGQVGVPVDQAGNQCVARDVKASDGIRDARARGLDAADPVAGDQYIGRKRGLAAAIPYPATTQQNRVHRFPRIFRNVKIVTPTA